MITQKKINSICEAIKRDGQEITIENVRNLLDYPKSFFSIAKKVLTYKQKGFECGEKLDVKKINGENLENKLLQDISDFLKFDKINWKKLEPLFLEKIMFYKKELLAVEIQKLELYLKKTQEKNDHIEVKYYGLISRFKELNIKFKEIEESYYNLQQRHQRAIAKVKNNDQNKSTKPIKLKTVEEQIIAINSDYYGVYDIKRKYIIVKVPENHKLVKEFEKGEKSIHLRASSKYDFHERHWTLFNFEAQTINLLLKNKIIISKELSYLLELLQK